MMVFAQLTLDGSLGGRRRGGTNGELQTRISQELERRHPEGAGRLRVSYFVYRRRRQSRVLCFGVPQWIDPNAVCMAALVPMRVLVRRRVVVFYAGDGYLGCACFDRGIPHNIRGVARRHTPRWTLERALAVIPADFQSAETYLLIGNKAPSAADGELVREACRLGIRTVGERRVVSSDPKLTGKKRKPSGLRRPSVLIAANIGLVVLLAAALAPASGPAPGATRGDPREDVHGADGTGLLDGGGPRGGGPRDGGGPREATRGSGATGGSRPPDAARALASLGEPLEPLTDRVRVEEVSADGARIRMQGTGVPAEEVVRRLADAAGFTRAVLVSQEREGPRRRFVVEVESVSGKTQEAGAGPEPGHAPSPNPGAAPEPGHAPSPNPGAAPEPNPEKPEPETSTWREAVSPASETRELMAKAGLSVTELHRSGEGYRVRAAGTYAEIGAAIAALAGDTGRVRVETLSLVRHRDTEWELSMLVNHVPLGEMSPRKEG
ncbi:MAG: hypothetical protein R6V29_14480 [Spirochaetia bacterium]